MDDMDIVLEFCRVVDIDQTRAALDQAERLLGCYQTALGHELPNRLVAIQGLARLLASDHLSEEERHLLDRLASLTQRTDELVRALAVIGRLGRELKAGGCSVPDEVAAEAATEMNLLSPGRPIEYHKTDFLPLLAVPRGALHQVLLHLLRNAVQSAVADRPLRIVLALRRVAGGVEFRVTDNGRGMEDSQADTLFDPLRSSTTARHGLGLFLVRQIVAGVGGRLRVESEVGHGTTVTVLFHAAGASSRPDI
jgi:two-component system nitrogen regulation sensor histidine kinase GlnL